MKNKGFCSSPIQHQTWDADSYSSDEQHHRIILTPITRKYIHSLCGKYKGKGLLKALIAEKKFVE